MRRYTPLRVGQEIRELLLASSGVTAMVGSDIFPYYTQVDVQSPHIVYTNINVQYASTKDGAEADTATLTLVCNTTDYEAGIHLAECVEGALDVDGITIDGIYVSHDPAALMFSHEISITVEYD